MKYEAVYVEWIDSVSLKQVWHSFSDVTKDHTKTTDKMQTIAYMIFENKKEYVFCNSIHFEEDKAVHAGNIFKIPKGCVTKIKRFKK